MSKELKPYILIAPIVLLTAGILGIGLFSSLSQSIGFMKVAGLNKLTFEYYKEVITDRGFQSSVAFSLFISTVSSLVSTVLGIIVAYCMYRLKISGRVDSILTLPVIVPHIVVALFMYNILSQTGMVSKMLYFFGMIDKSSEFAELIFDRRGLGIILAYLWKEVPFIVMVTYAILKKVDERLIEVAKNLGASNYDIFIDILLPMIAPAAVSAFIIIFAFSFGAYEIPMLLGPTVPQALPVKAFIEYSNPNIENRPFAMAINTIMAVFSLLMVILFNTAFKMMTIRRVKDE